MDTAQNPLPTRTLGHGGPVVPAIGLGCMGMSSTYQPADDSRSIGTVHRALELGMSHLDTADMYGRGHNESLLGRALAGRRDEVFLATKFGYRFDSTGRRFIDSTGEWARRACHESLTRLGTDHIDLYYVHRRHPEVPIEDTMGALSALVEDGLVRHLGLSEVSPRTLRAAHAIHPVTAVQMEYSLFSRDVEGEMLATCRELGVGLVCYAPIGRGWLTGTITGRGDLAIDDSRRAHPRFADDATSVNAALVHEVGEVATELGATTAQVALAWLLHQGTDVVPIPGTTRPDHLADNAAASRLELLPEHVDRLERIFRTGAAKGARHTPEALSTLGT